MDLLFRILYAAHANGPHHKLALDALTKLAGPNAETWRRLFLANAEGYMTGSKAPDTTFKDFKNHVLHVQENNWGGAPAKSRAWYGTLVSELKAQRWAEAVYAAGVLSHYVVDPVMPFHTGQSDEENTIHRAAEWSISRSYDGLKSEGEAAPRLPLAAAGSGATWLEDLVIAGAQTSNPFYWDLIHHYDFAKGVSDPPSGLDKRSREIAAKLIVYASGEFALVLDRAIAEAGVQPPEVNLTAETILATLKVPLKFITKKLEDAADKREVEAMYAELLATGKVDQTLAPQEKIVRALHAQEVLAPKAAAQAAAPVAVALASVSTPSVGTSAAATSAASADPMSRFFSWCSEQASVRAKADAWAAQPVALFAGLASLAAPRVAVAAAPVNAPPVTAARVLPAAPQTVPQAAVGSRPVAMPAAAPASVAARLLSIAPRALPEAEVRIVPVAAQPKAIAPAAPVTAVAAAVEAEHAREAVPSTTAHSTPTPSPSPQGGGESPHFPLPLAGRAGVGVAEPPAMEASARPHVEIPPAAIEPAHAAPVVVPHEAPAPVSRLKPKEAHHDAHDDAPRIYLAASDDVERGPSVGPKTAERLHAVGVVTVSDLLAADPVKLSAALQAKHIRPATIIDWQDQARLVMGVPGLRGTHAQLLVGAGFRTPDSLAEVAPDVLSARVLAFAATGVGQRILHEGDPPEMEKIASWRSNVLAKKAA